MDWAALDKTQPITGLWRHFSQLLCVELMHKLMFGTDRYASGLTLEQQCEAEVLFRIWSGGLCISGFSWPAFDMGVRCFELDLFARFLLYMNPWIKSDTLYQDCFVYWRSHFLFKKKAANSASTREDYPIRVVLGVFFWNVCLDLSYRIIVA